jgi:hypothetical protein
MNTNGVEKTKIQAEILLTLPNEVLEDLKKIASFNNTALKDLVFSYVVDGIACDSEIMKRTGFKSHINDIAGKSTFYSRTAEEIIKDFKLD